MLKFLCFSGACSILISRETLKTTFIELDAQAEQGEYSCLTLHSLATQVVLLACVSYCLVCLYFSYIIQREQLKLTLTLTKLSFSVLSHLLLPFREGSLRLEQIYSRLVTCIGRELQSISRWIGCSCNLTDQSQTLHGFL